MFTGTPGKYIPLKKPVRSFRMIVDGKCERLPEQAFYITGTIGEAGARASPKHRPAYSACITDTDASLVSIKNVSVSRR